MHIIRAIEKLQLQCFFKKIGHNPLFATHELPQGAYFNWSFLELN